MQFSVFAHIAWKELSGFTLQVRIVGNAVVVYARLHRDVSLSFHCFSARRVKSTASSSIT